MYCVGSMFILLRTEHRIIQLRVHETQFTKVYELAALLESSKLFYHTVLILDTTDSKVKVLLGM